MLKKRKNSSSDAQPGEPAAEEFVTEFQKVTRPNIIKKGKDGQWEIVVYYRAMEKAKKVKRFTYYRGSLEEAKEDFV